MPKNYSCPYYVNKSKYNTDNMYNKAYPMNQCPYSSNTPMCNSCYWKRFPMQSTAPMNQSRTNMSPKLKDYGPDPLVINITQATLANDNFRTAIWTGNHLQLTLMSINVGEDIGLEIHPDIDQFIRIEEGQGVVRMGKRKDRLEFVSKVSDDFAILIPAGTWHNITNTGDIPLKLYSIYAPPQHPFGTVHVTKEDAMEAEENHE